MTIKAQLEEIIETQFRCYNCNKPTDRFIKFRTALGIIEEFECLNCRYDRVKKQVDAGLRPATDLLPENLPERR